METQTLEQELGLEAVDLKSIFAPALQPEKGCDYRAEKTLYKEHTKDGAALEKAWTSAYSAE